MDKVLIGQSRLSLPASGREQLYVSVSRGRQQAMLFTDDKQALREAVSHEHERLTATEVFHPRKQPGQERLKQHMAYLRRCEAMALPAGKSSHGRTALQREQVYERE